MEKLGRVVFKLYDEYAPQACHNFRSICEGAKDMKDEPLTFAVTPQPARLPLQTTSPSDYFRAV